ncbi:MAG: helix-turn-helix transcriptional regulator [Clostridia bacterium]|nr:helix-turn-helix transcriptional regulator [Clostridia bacterium]
MNTLGERIAKLLDEKHISQKDLASMIGVTESALSRYINNEREPKIEVLANLATALDTTVDYLTTGKKLETDFDEIYRLVARSSYTLTETQKMQIIEAVMRNK